MGSFIQVITTTENKQDAEKIAKRLVERKLAACVQIIGPISSIYRWKDSIERAEEWLLLIKSKENLYEEVEITIKKMHSYEIPEIIALPIAIGSREYLEWLKNELK